MLLKFVLLPFFLVLIIFTLFYFVSTKATYTNLMISTFECGYSSVYSSRYSFSIHYVLIVMIFVLLDLEFSLTFWFFSSKSSSMLVFLLTYLLLICALLSLMYEYYESKLDWEY